MGIKEGRDILKKYGTNDIDSHIENLIRTKRGFKAGSPVGDMLRGELDFWRNQKVKGVCNA